MNGYIYTYYNASILVQHSPTVGSAAEAGSVLAGHVALKVPVVVAQFRSRGDELVREERDPIRKHIIMHIGIIRHTLMSNYGAMTITHLGSRTSCESVNTVTFSRFGEQLWFRKRATLPSHLCAYD